MLAHAAYGAIASGIVFVILAAFVCWLAYQSSTGDKRTPNAKNAKKDPLHVYPLKPVLIGKKYRQPDRPLLFGPI